MTVAGIQRNDGRMWSGFNWRPLSHFGKS